MTTVSSTTSSQTKNDSNLKKPRSSPINEKLLEITRARRNKRNIIKSTIRRKRKDLAVPMGIGFGMKSLIDILFGNKVDNNPMFKRNGTYHFF